MLPDNSRARRIVVTRRMVGVSRKQIPTFGQGNFNDDPQNLLGYSGWRLLPVLPEKIPSL